MPVLGVHIGCTQGQKRLHSNLIDLDVVALAVLDRLGGLVEDDVVQGEAPRRRVSRAGQHRHPTPLKLPWADSLSVEIRVLVPGVLITRANRNDTRAHRPRTNESTAIYRS